MKPSRLAPVGSTMHERRSMTSKPSRLLGWARLSVTGRSLLRTSLPSGSLLTPTASDVTEYAM